MKKLHSLIAVLFALVALSACTRVPAGFEGVKFNLYGDNKGLDVQAVPPGQYWVGFNQKLYTYPTFNHQYPFTASAHEGSPNNEAITFQTKDGMSSNVDVAVQARVIPGQSPKVFAQFKKEFPEIVHTFVYQDLRDHFNAYASTMVVDETYGEKKMELVRNVHKDLREKYLPFGIDIESISYLSDVRPPPQIVQAINAKIEATQKSQQRENEIKTADAQAKIDAAKAGGEAQSITIKAKATADANRIIAASLTPEFVQYEALQRWDGKLPTMTGSGAIPFVTVGAPVK